MTTLKSYHFRDKLECGLDEVARGVLFGRVYAGAVIWPNDITEPDGIVIKDSKALSARKRLIMADYIKENAIDYAISYVDEKAIDRTNILRSAIQAMHNAIGRLNIIPEVLLVDGDKFKSYACGFNKFIPHHLFPGGDSTYKSIACASILAKVEHDKYIANMINDYPELKIYSLETNMGYATKAHRVAIEQYGPSPWHRKTFCRVKEYLGTVQWLGKEHEIEEWRDEIHDKLQGGHDIIADYFEEKNPSSAGDPDDPDDDDDDDE